MPTIPVVFAIEHAELSDPDLDNFSPNHYAFFIGAMDLPRRAPKADPLNPAATAETLGRFEAALLASNAQDGETADLSAFGADVINVPGLAPFVTFAALAESNLSLAERQDWTQRHLSSAAQAALGAFVLDLSDFFPKTPGERAAAVDAWSSLCLDPSGAHRRPPPPLEPFLAAFAQWEAKALEAALARDSDRSPSAQLPRASSKLAPRSL